METVTTEELPKHILDARLTAQKLQEKYKNDPRQSSVRILVLGEGGTGKSSLIRTARRPVHIDSFDPGGTVPLRDLIQRELVIADTLYEQEDPTHPEMFQEWRRNFEERIARKYFDNIGTYCLDSSTMWADSIMNWILKNARGNDGKPIDLSGKAPRFTHDYTPQKVEINNYMHKILALPCDVIVTGHMNGVYEHITTSDGEEYKKLVKYEYMTTGKGAVIIPLLFSEIWITITKETSKGTDYRILTSRQGAYCAKSRMGRDKFEREEVPDIKALLAKAGWPCDDKPRLT